MKMMIIAATAFWAPKMLDEAARLMEMRNNTLK
jgi:hypothetical protein